MTVSKLMEALKGLCPNTDVYYMNDCFPSEVSKIKMHMVRDIYNDSIVELSSIDIFDPDRYLPIVVLE